MIFQKQILSDVWPILKETITLARFIAAFSNFWGPYNQIIYPIFWALDRLNTWAFSSKLPATSFTYPARE